MSLTPERLRLARERKNLKQTQVRDRTGINNKTLSGYENGVSEPDLETLKLLAELYEVSLDWLSGHTDDPSPFIAVKENIYDYTKDPTVTAELRKLLDELMVMPIEEREAVINQARIFAEGIKAKSRSGKKHS